ncbi:MAG: AsmA family protein, partial [Deltaproteobacteria bacterium]|nr:AsmA family protein [Deltaproteobacteria bacterium]
MRRKASLVLSIIVLVLLLLVVGGVLFIKSDFAADRMCNLVREGLSKSLGLKVSTEACSIDLLPPTLEVLQLKIDDQNGGRLLDVGRLKVELDSLALLTGHIRLDKVVLVKPEIHLAFKNGAFDGLPQFSQEQKEQKEDGSNLVPEQIAIENGRIYVIV